MTSFVPLSARLADTQAMYRVAYVAQKEINSTQLRTDIARHLEQLQNYDEQYWGVFCDDSYAFLVALIALLLSGKTPLLLPNLQSGFLSDIDELQALISDREQILSALPQLHIVFHQDNDSNKVVLPSLQKDRSHIVLYTSGSTGQPKRIVKTLEQLETEVRVLEGLWSVELGDAIVFSTVSHQHIYGLLFRVLWPFFCGRCFDSRTYQYPEPLLQQMMRQVNSVLISSPAHLKRMPGLVDLPVVRGKLSAIFSSGGPLMNTVAVAIHQALAVNVYEVFGSTETGGVAYRAQRYLHEETPWTPLPQVEIALDSKAQDLSIRSPFEGSGQWYMMSDIAEVLADGRFILRGRSDKIVKVEEKRLSLSELEQRLLACEWITEVAATVLHAGRSRVAVVAVLSRTGSRLYQQEGKLQFDRCMRSYLAQFFEAVVLPKKWRYVEHLPYNVQGKLPHAAIEALFVAERHAVIHEVEPHIRLIRKEACQVVLELNIPANLLYFDGHFPGNPVLPGVVQLQWAVLCAERYLGFAATYQHMEAIKFHEFIRPNDNITLNLKIESEEHKLYFSYDSNKGRHSSGRLLGE